MWPFQCQLRAGGSPEELGITEIRESLKILCSQDWPRDVFGASRHQYASVPVPAQEMERLEDALGVRPPEEFRHFLMRIGYGAGPYYGILSPARILAEFRGLNAEYEDDQGIEICASDPFPLTREDLRAIEARLAERAEKPYGAIRSSPCGGCIFICHQGCTFYNALVTSGEFTGTVWDVDPFDGDYGEWLPARRPTGIVRPGWIYRERLPLPSPPTFHDWYLGWLEQCFTDLEAA